MLFLLLITSLACFYWIETNFLGNEIGVRMLNDGSLQLEHAEAENAGSYYCNATNVAGSRVHLIDLRVFRKFR